MKKIKQIITNYDYVLLSAFIFTYVLFFSIVCIKRYITFNFDDYDLAIHAQMIWNILHSNPVSSIMLGMKMLGGPLWLISFLIAPVYWIFPSALTLLVLQALLVGLGAWPVFLIAREKLGKTLALYLSFAYLLFPALWYVNYFEFHQLALTIPFLLFAFHYLIQGKYFKYLIFLLLTNLCNADMALVVFMFGVYALLEKKSLKWFITPFLISIAWVIIGVFILIPHFRSPEIQYDIYYAQYGKNFYDAAKNIILNPSIIFRYLFLKQNAVLLFQLLTPVGFLPLFAPKELMIASLALLQHLSSVRGTEHTIYFHYTAPLIPFIFISLIFSLYRIIKTRLFSKLNKAVIGIVIISLGFACNVSFGPIKVLKDQLLYLRKNDFHREVDRIIKMIPANAPLISTFQYLPNLANREYLYSFHHIYCGRLFPSSKNEYRPPENIEYALVNFTDPAILNSFKLPDSDIRLRKFFSGYDWGVVSNIDNIVLFKKGIKATNKLYEVSKEVSNVKKNKAGLAMVDDSIEFLSYDLHADKERARVLDASLTFRCKKEIKAELWMAIEVKDVRGGAVQQFIRPICYGIYPTQRWQPGENIRDNFSLLIPKSFNQHEYYVRLAVFYWPSYRIPDLRPSSKNILDGNYMIKLGKIAMSENELKVFK